MVAAFFCHPGRGEGGFIPLCLPPQQAHPGRSRLAKLALPKGCKPGSEVPLGQLK